MKLLTDRTPEYQFDNFSHEVIEQIRTRKIKQRIDAQLPIRHGIIAHKKLEGQRKKLIYVEIDSLLHLVANGKSREYFKLRRDIPDKVIFYSTQKELTQEIESRGFFI